MSVNTVDLQDFCKILACVIYITADDYSLLFLDSYLQPGLWQTGSANAAVVGQGGLSYENYFEYQSLVVCANPDTGLKDRPKCKNPILAIQRLFIHPSQRCAVTT